MKQSMDLFGEALLSYSKGNKSKFYFADSKNKYQHPLNRYFRKYRAFTKIEKKILSMSKGNILDVGCGTGIYIPYLMKHGKVLGIDISSNTIQICKNKKLNCKTADIFNFKTNQKFDTIVLLENNLGMAETLPKTKKLIKILSNMLTKNGCILTNARNVPKNEYYIAELYPIYKNKIGPNFKWISFNPKYLSKLCQELNLKLEIIERSNNFYLAKITKK